MGARLSGPQGGAVIDQNADMNVTPFVDIMLVLLIIFMVAAPLATVSLRLDIPPARDPVGPAIEPVYVTVAKDGALYVRGERSSAATLAADVCAALGPDCHEQRVFVRGDAETRYGAFMAVMNDLNAKGFAKVGLVNEDIL